MEIHIVKAGETASDIAAEYNVSVSRLIYDNQLEYPDSLIPGQALLILRPVQTHVVEQGESLYSIANRYQLSILQLVRNNLFILGSQILQAGETLVITYEGQENEKKFIQVGGYAYPFIIPSILQETLPFLRELFIFSYGFTEEGELLPTDDTELIMQAKAFGVEPILVLTSIGRDGTFNNQLVNTLLESEEIQNRVIDALVETVQEKGYEGVDLDFEYILPQDRDAYVVLVQKIADRMHAIGRTVSVALPPKVSADQKGLLYEGIDYAGLGAAADTVLLMTYEWGYKYGPPMAVAPIPQVRKVLDYAVTEISRDKIHMGIPNYGYDWPLPYERGVTQAETIGNIQALQIARENGASILYDEMAKAPYFYYTKDGILHEVWFEDVRSILAKMELIQEYDFRGAGYWNLMRPFRANWLLVNDVFQLTPP